MLRSPGIQRTLVEVTNLGSWLCLARKYLSLCFQKHTPAFHLPPPSFTFSGKPLSSVPAPRKLSHVVPQNAQKRARGLAPPRIPHPGGSELCSVWSGGCQRARRAAERNGEPLALDELHPWLPLSLGLHARRQDTAPPPALPRGGAWTHRVWVFDDQFVGQPSRPKPQDVSG